MGTGARAKNESRCSSRSSLLERLVDEHYEPVLRLLTRLTASVSAAEDLAQTTFASLVRSWKPLANTAEDRAYVIRTAYNAWRRWGRKTAADPVQLQASDELRAENSSPLDKISAKEEMGLVRAALDELQGNHRAALVLIVLEGMSYDEVADLMAVPRDTVSKWRTRALTRMCRALTSAQVRLGDVWDDR